MRFRCLPISCFLLSFALQACGKDASCAEVIFEGLPFTVCETTSVSDIRLFLRDEAGEILGDFDGVKAELEGAGLQLDFAMNAGMYHADRSAVGLYIENGVQQSKLNVNKGPGNFHMLPNGVFWISAEGSGVTSADNFKSSDVVYATQSGPMLVIDNDLHPSFREDSTSFRIRNGVGQTADGQVFFVKSDLLVNFHTFARLFRDELGTPNALYLDGTVSKLYSSDLKRNDTGHQMGPIIAVVQPRSQ